MQRRLSELTGEMEMGVNPVGSPTDAFLTMDSEWRFTYLNEPAERMLAQTKESLMGRVAWEAFPEAAGSVFQRQYQRALDERRMVAFEAFFHPLSTWFHIRAYPSQGGVAVCFQDITVLKRLEACRNDHCALLERVASDAPIAELLLQSVELMESFHPSSKASILLLDEERRHIRVAAAPSIPSAFTKTVEGLEITSQSVAWGDAIRNGEVIVVPDISESPLWEGFHDLAAACGLGSWWSVPIRAGVGAAVGGFGVYCPSPCRPTQEELEIGEACARLVGLALQRDRLRDQLRAQASYLDEAREAIIFRDLDHRIRYWNQGAEVIYGWSAEEAVGKRASDLIYEDADVYSAAFDSLVTHGAWDGEVKHRRKDGSVFTAGCHWALVADAEGRNKGTLAVNTDATRRLELEAQLHRAQRLEAIGQLTGGVAHDFNNLLTIILGNSDLLAEKLEHEPALYRSADLIRNAAQSGGELTKRLLAFARRQALEPKAVDVNKVLTGMDSLLRRTLGEDLDLETIRGAGLWSALVDSAQLENVVLNLCINARDAMSEGGRLTLETTNASIDEAYADQHLEVEPGQYVMITVSDTGTGIPPEILAKVFDPFFTTKEPGKGTGLGLSMAYGFAKQSNGHISIYSEVGHGTTVRLYLPRSEHPAEGVASVHQSDAAYRGTETILLVEDHESVRVTAEHQLQSLGYRVLTASDGESALAMLLNEPSVAVLFTDVVMPGGMSGRELAEAARAIRPDLKVLFTSGYTENSIVHHGRLDPGVHLLHKPYRKTDLAKKLRAVILEPKLDSGNTFT
ncbi:MAG: PAS domain S-box protein [Acidobacteria bacterium]|nr:PAS domain S-box protein [Acidobacteriota bacterium]